MIRPNPFLYSIDRDDDRTDIPEGFVSLHRNERPSPYPAGVLADMLARVRPEHFTLYPNPKPLYERLGRHAGLPEDHLILTPGSDGAFRRCMHGYLRPGDPVLTPDPTYTMYAIYARLFQGTVATVPYRSDLTLDVPRFIRAIRPGVRVVVLANPGQPTGTALGEAEVRAVIEAAAGVDALCLIDEAYYPYGPFTALPLVRDYDNLVVTRSFSKNGGIAGLRLGFAAARPHIIDILNRVRGGAEINGMAIVAGCYLLDHPEVTAQYRREVFDGKAVLGAAARRIGLSVPECSTNFQLLRLPAGLSPTALAAKLEQKGYLVKAGFASHQLADCIRVTLDGPAIMEPFAAALEQCVADLRGGAQTSP